MSATEVHSGVSEIARQLAAMETVCAIYDLSSGALARAKIRLTGEDRVRWLNGMVTNNIRDLEPNHGNYNYFLNAQGRIQGDLYAYNLGDSLLLDIAAAQRDAILAYFDKYIIMDDVEVADISDSIVAIGLAGPQSRNVMRAAGIEVPEITALECCTPKCECDCQCVECTVIRTDDPSGNAYEIWLAPNQVKTSWDALQRAGAIEASPEAMEERRVQLGIPRYGVDIRERDLPQETGQERALNFSKGCYLGQEIVERIRSRGQVHRMFTKFRITGEHVPAGSKIISGEKEVGEITSVSMLAAADGITHALGYIRREFAGKELSANGAKVETV